MKGTTSGQKRIVATVSSLKEEVDRQGVETPAIIVVGKVCALAGEFAWYEKLPLAGMKVLVTRPKELISQMSEKLRRKGAEVLELPAVATVPIWPNPALSGCISSLSEYQWIVFTSPAGVRIFFDALAAEHRDVRALGGVRVAAIGGGTAKALAERGIYTDLVPEVYDGESLGEALAGKCTGNERILIPRAAAGNQELVKALEKVRGVRVEDIPTYDTVYEKQDFIDERAEFENGSIDYAVFTSASTVRGFAKAVEGLDYSTVSAVCIGKQTQAAAAALGMKTYVAKQASMDSIVEALEKLAARDRTE